MNRRLTTRVLLGVLACPWLVLGTAPIASAVPGLVTDPAFGPPLTTITVTGAGFCSTCGPASIQIGSLYVATAVHVTGAGRFSTLVRIPGTTRPGTVPVTASQKGLGGAVIRAESDFTVTINVPAPTTYPAPTTQPPPGGLPSTSSPNTSRATTSPPNTSRTTAPVGSATSTGTSSTASTATTAPSPSGTPGSGPTATATSDTRSAAENGSTWSPEAVIGAVALGLAGAGAWIVRRRRRYPTR